MSEQTPDFAKIAKQLEKRITTHYGSVDTGKRDSDGETIYEWWRSGVQESIREIATRLLSAGLSEEDAERIICGCISIGKSEFGG